MHTGQDLRTVIPVRIRPFEDRDYKAVVGVENAAFPDRPGTVEEWRYDDEHYDRTTYTQERYVAEDPGTGAVVAYAGFWHIPWAFHPQRFGVGITVHPEFQRRGIGTRLWGWLQEPLRAAGARVLRAHVWEKMPASVRFARRLGFREVLRAWESRLDVETFDVARWRPHVDRALAAGVAFTTLAAEREKDPANVRRVYEMDTEMAADVPRPEGETFTPVAFTTWTRYVVDGPWSLPEAYFIAVVGGEYAGSSALYRPQAGDWLNQGLTGVRRPFRGMGLATALKVHTVQYARARGIREIRTHNEIHNAPILAINERFGFVRQPAWITFRKELDGPSRVWGPVWGGCPSRRGSSFSGRWRAEQEFARTPRT